MTVATTRKPKIRSLLLAAITCVALGGCTDKRGDCAWTGTCPDDDTAGGAGGKSSANRGGTAGTANGGTATSSGGSAGAVVSTEGGADNNGGAAGGGAAGQTATSIAGSGMAGNGTAGSGAAGSGTAASGTAGTSAIPCNGACTGTTSICDESSNTCVACLVDSNCPATAPACKANTCVACTKDTNCSGAAPACDTEMNVCVPCTADKYCPSALPACNANKTCVACTANSHCSGTKPACDVLTNTCVECNTNGDCVNVTGRTVCDIARNTCVECMSNSTCTDAAKPQCNTTTKACVACLSNADCKTAAASLCNTTTNTCGPCVADADCSLIAGKTVCLQGATPQANQCVQCTGKKYAACGQAGGKALVCDSLAHTCSTTATAQSSGLCKTCISDAQCGAGQLCSQQTFNGQPVGYFCFWKQGDTANGAPSDCTLQTNRPYVNIQTNAVSIDNDTATLCTLRAVTTCTALNQYSSTNCASASNTANDSLCGFAPGVDSKCVAFGASQFLCTTTCLSDFDCKTGATCNTNVTPNVCNL